MSDTPDRETLRKQLAGIFALRQLSDLPALPRVRFYGPNGGEIPGEQVRGIFKAIEKQLLAVLPTVDETIKQAEAHATFQNDNRALLDEIASLKANITHGRKVNQEQLESLEECWEQFAYSTGNVLWPFTDGGLSTLEHLAYLLMERGCLDKRVDKDQYRWKNENLGDA